MYTHPHFNIPKCHRLSSCIAYSPTSLNRLTGSTKRNQTLEIPCHEYREFNKNITKWTLIIGHDSCSWFCLFLYNRLTPTVYNLTVWHWHSKITIAEQTKHLSQLTDLTYLPPPPCCPPALSFIIYKTMFYHESSQFFSLLFLPSLYFPITFFLFITIICMISKIWHNMWLTFFSPPHPVAPFVFFA